jgi:hypothetical protein
VVDRDIEVAATLGGVPPSGEPEPWADNVCGEGGVETAENEGEGGWTCTVPGDIPDETLTLRTLIRPPSGMTTGREAALASTWLCFSRSFRSATAALTSA